MKIAIDLPAYGLFMTIDEVGTGLLSDMTPEQRAEFARIIPLMLPGVFHILWEGLGKGESDDGMEGKSQGMGSGESGIPVN